MATPGDRRPTLPAATLLSLAKDAAGQMTSESCRHATWVVGEPLRNRYSTIFPIQLVREGATLLHAYYKVHLPAVHRDIADVAQATRTEPEILWSLTRGPELAPVLNDELAPIDMHVPHYLAVDTPSLTEVVTGIAGVHPQKLFWAAATRRRTREGLDLYRRVGTAVATIEGMPIHGALDVDRPLDRAVPLVELAGRTERLPVDDVLSALRTTYEGAAEAGLAYQHGDVGLRNILVAGRRTGLIDFGWPIRLRGQDVALFILRLRMQRPVVRPVVDAAVSALAEGYGDPDLVTRPVYRFVRLWALTTLVAVPTMAGRGSRFREAELRRSLLEEVYA